MDREREETPDRIIATVGGLCSRRTSEKETQGLVCCRQGPKRSWVVSESGIAGTGRSR